MVVYGGWAVFANADHGAAVSIRAGLVQGTYSLVLTFLMTLVTESLHAKLGGTALGNVAVVGIVCMILFVTPFGIHMLNGTPEILMTILPGFLIGCVYTAVYVVGLHRGTKQMATGLKADVTD